VKFGQRYEDAPPAPTGGGDRFLKNFREGETRLRFLQEVKDWLVYWEHFNPAPGGFPFPCTGDRETCPGCTSGIEKMEKASRKALCNVKVGDYVDVYKFQSKLANKMEIRSERNGGTILNRDFIITRIGKDTQTDYDIDGMQESPLDPKPELLDAEAMLAQAFRDAWPDFDMGPDAPKAKPQDTVKPLDEGKGPAWALSETEVENLKKAQDSSEPVKPSGLGEFAKAAPKEPEPETEVTEADLRRMTPEQLRELCTKEKIVLPEALTKTDEIVDWLIAQMG